MTDYEIEMELEAALEALPKENPPVNLSDWNSGSDYKEKLASVVKLGKKSDLFDYQYFFPDCIKKDLAHIYNVLGITGKADLKALFIGYKF